MPGLGRFAASVAQIVLADPHRSCELKYLHRLWLKGNPKQDAEKARWYLLRLLERL